MNPIIVMDVLNELYRAERGSLFRYLATVPEYTGHSRWARLLPDMIERSVAFADRLEDLIVAQQGIPAPGRFDPAFTSLHDLSLQYLLGWMIRDKERLAAEYAKARTLLLESGQPVPEGLMAFLREAEGAHRDDLTRLLEQRQPPKSA